MDHDESPDDKSEQNRVPVSRLWADFGPENATPGGGTFGLPFLFTAVFLPKRSQQVDKVTFSRTEGKACHCPCRVEEACHLDAFIAAWEGEAAYRLGEDQTLVAKVPA